MSHLRRSLLSTMQLVRNNLAMTVLFVGMIGCLSMVAAPPLLAAPGPGEPQPYSNAVLQRELRYGFETAVALDYSTSAAVGVSPEAAANYSSEKVRDTDPGRTGPCYSVLATYPLPGAPVVHPKYTTRSGQDLFYRKFTPTSNDGTGISAADRSASYRADVWLSLRGQPNVKRGSTVPVGTTRVDLQINTLSFSCRPFSEPVPARSCNLTGLQWMNTPTGWIRTASPTSPIDSPIHSTAPNWNPPYDAGTSNCFTNEKIWQRTMPTAYSVISGGGSATGPTGPTAQTITARKDRSRFWFSNPAGVTYTSTPITSDKLITIQMVFKRQNQYVVAKDGQDYLQATCFDNRDRKVTKDIPLIGTPNPNNTNPMLPWGGNSDGDCKTYTTDFSFLIKVATPQWETDGDTALLSPSKVSAGSVVNWNHSVRSLAASQQITPQIGYKVMQSINGVGAPPRSTGTIAPLSPGQRSPLIGGSYTTTSADIGKTICQWINWEPWKDQTTGSKDSERECVEVVATPHVQVWGHDVRVGSAPNLSTNKNSQITTRSSSPYGSWGEYGVFAPSDVSDFGSGHGLHGGSVTAETEWNRLTFANTLNTVNCTGISGCFVEPANLANLGSLPTNTIKNYLASSGLPTSTAANNNTVPALVQVYRPTGGTFTITRDIVNASPADPNNLPQVFIVANNIRINDNVGRVDAWLIADDTIDTCANFTTAQLTTDRCNRQLVINGPIMAKKLDLERTMLPTAAEQDKPAEILNLRADAWVWSYKQSLKTSKIKTTFIRELPPRF